MKEEKIRKTIQKKAGIFKSRALISPTDGKRHDLIKTDERKAMYSVYLKFGWSYAKIASDFNRDARTVKVSIEEEQKILTRRKEEQKKKEQHTERVLIQQKQKEHIKILQQMATNALSRLPDFSDLQQNPEVFDSFNYAVVGVYRRLIGDVDWNDIAEHLGDEGKEIEMMASVLDDVLPGGSLVKPKLDEYKRELEKAWSLIKFGGLKTISESSDTRKWEWEDLNQRCHNCPDWDYEPVDISP